jgi:diguanylate cyclase
MLENTSFLPTYNASPQQNSQYVRQLLPLMMKHNIPVNPINYAVWYHYVSGDNADLNEAIDTLIHDQKPFDYDTNLSLYKKYVCTASLESMEKVNSGLQRLITETTLSVNATSEKASLAGENFNVNLQKLKASDSGVNLEAILFEIISETMQLAETSKALKNQLDSSNQELDQLRNELSTVREAANIDGLTGLFNRLAFDKALQEIIENKTSKNVCLAILDLDHFKRINDSFGHLIGDKVIKYFASLLKQYAAKNYHVARYGGEEMVIIMPDTTLTEAFNSIEQIRRALDSSRLKYKGDTESIGKVTLSAGISLLREEESAYSFIERADNALYRAKGIGRNKVVTES